MVILSSNTNLLKVVDFLFEVGNLNKIKRSIRKVGKSSIAEHSYRVTLIGYILASLSRLQANKVNKIILMCLFHDLIESRIGDPDLINKRYSDYKEEKALREMTTGLVCGNKIKQLINELNKERTDEAKITHDADIIEEILSDKEYYDGGGLRANEWMKYSFTKLRTNIGKKIAKIIIERNSDEWWYKLLEK